MSRPDPTEPQRVDTPLTLSATFLVLSVTNDPDAIRTVRSTLASIDDLTKNVAIRDLDAKFVCTVGIGSDVWDRVTGLPGRLSCILSLPSRAWPIALLRRLETCSSTSARIAEIYALSDAVTVIDETVGFRYFDVRDLLGFVDGTANPVGPAVPASTLVADEDASATGGSYIVVQKYIHDLKGWRALPAETQEAIIGRTKLDNIELDDAESGQQSHKTLATIKDGNGDEHEILRDNMPFGSPGSGEFGTYFIGYSQSLWVIERMLQRMFVGDPPGLHDRLLDFSKPVTGTTFFAPSATLLASLDLSD
ncbi:hypothetical protein ACLOAV_000254 [Pseudogymnoascus australis]